MADFVKINNSTLVTGTTSTGFYLAVDINDKNVGFPLFEFSESTPDIELIQLNPSVDLVLPQGTLYNSSTSYGAGVAMMVNGSAYAVPLFKIKQDDDVIPAVSFKNPTLVINLSSTSQFLVINVKEQYYGVPLFDYDKTIEYPFLSSNVVTSINITTEISLGKPVLDINDFQVGTTNLNSKITAYSDLIFRIKKLLGWPTISLNICDEDIITCIDQAIELFTKYAGFTEEYLIFRSNLYKTGYGIKLDDLFSVTPELFKTPYNSASACYDYDLKDYRRVMSVWSYGQGEGTGINTLFTIEQIVANQVYFGNLLGQNGFDLVTYDILKGWLDTREKVLAQTPYIRFDDKTQIMRIFPEPSPQELYHGLIGCYVERPIKHLISEQWVIWYSLALTKILIGTIRSKYNAQLFGGVTINFNELLNDGKTEKTELEKQLFTGTGLNDYPGGAFFVG